MGDVVTKFAVSITVIPITITTFADSVLVASSIIVIVNSNYWILAGEPKFVAS